MFAVLLAIFGPLVRPYDPNEVNLSYANVGPTGGHLLGFDGAGRDLLSRLMVGARTTLLGAALVAIVAVVDRLEPGRPDRLVRRVASTPPSPAVST